MKIYQNIISDYFYLATIPLLDFNSRGGRWLDHKKHLVNIWWLEWINKWINKRINGYVLVWYNYRFLLFLNMLVQLTKHVVLLFLVQVDWPTVHIYLFSPKMPHYNDNKIMFLKGVKPHEENAEAIHGWHYISGLQTWGRTYYAEMESPAEGTATPPAEPGRILGTERPRSYQEWGIERRSLPELRGGILILFYPLCKWLRNGGEGGDSGF